MSLYEVRLESPVDRQARVVTLDADTPEQAKDVAYRQELAIVEFSLLPPSKDVWERPPGSDDSSDGIIDLSRWDAAHNAIDRRFAEHAARQTYEDARRLAHRRLENWTGRYETDLDGKVTGSDLPARSLARVLAHHQDQPYQVVDVAALGEPELDHRLVAQLVLLHQDPKRWEWTLEQLRARGIPIGAVTAALFGLSWQKQLDGSSVQVFSSASLQCTLHSGYSANYDTDDFFHDASASEISGTGYTAGGATIANPSITYTGGTNVLKLDGDDVSWASSTITARYAIIYDSTPGTAATNPLIAYVDFGADVVSNAGTFTITWAAGGIATVTVS